MIRVRLARALCHRVINSMDQCTRWNLVLRDLQQLTGLALSRRGLAVFAGGDARESGEVTPPEGRTRGVEVIPHGLEILLRVERSVLAYGIFQQGLEDSVLW